MTPALELGELGEARGPSVEAADPGRVGLDDEADDAEARALKAGALVDDLDAKARGFALELAATAGGGGDLRDGHVNLLELILAAREVARAVAGGDGERQEIALADVEEGLRDEDWRGLARVGHAGTGAEAAQARLHRDRAPPGGRVIAVVGLFRARQDEVAGAVPDAAALRRDARARGVVFERSVAAASDIESFEVRRGSLPGRTNAARRQSQDKQKRRGLSDTEHISGNWLAPGKTSRYFTLFETTNARDTFGRPGYFTGTAQVEKCARTGGRAAQKVAGTVVAAIGSGKLTLCSSGEGFRGASRGPPRVTLDDARASVDRGGGPRRGGTF